MGGGLLPAAVLVFDSDGTGGKAPLAPAAPGGAVAARDDRWHPACLRRAANRNSKLIFDEWDFWFG